jgi:hypothetical protein
MATVGEALLRLAADLGDAAPGHEFASWPREQLRGYLAEACQIVSEAKPGTFSRDLVLSFTGTRPSYDLCPCSTLSADEVLGQSDELGNVLWSLKPRPYGAKGRWPGPECPPPAKFRLREFSVSPDGRSIQFYPNIPPGLTVHLAARCSAFPSGDWDEVADKAYPAIAQYVLYRAKMVDGENNPAVLTAASKHLEAFSLLVGVRRVARRKPSGEAVTTQGLGSGDDSL